MTIYDLMRDIQDKARDLEEQARKLRSLSITDEEWNEEWRDFFKGTTPEEDDRELQELTLPNHDELN